MFATIDDVKRMLRLDGTTTTAAQDQRLQSFLDAAESRLRPRLMNFDAGSGTTVSYNVYAPSRIPLPIIGATIAQVRAWTTVSGGLRVFTTDEYTPEDQYVELEYPGFYQRVEVDWVYAGGVPEAVRDGVAMYAASLASRSQANSTGIKSERIGDYSYTISDAQVNKIGVPLDAWWMIKPYLKPRRVLTTP